MLLIRASSGWCSACCWAAASQSRCPSTFATAPSSCWPSCCASAHRRSSSRASTSWTAARAAVRARLRVLVAALWLNRSQPGLLVVMVGVAFNGLAILLNGGYMPVFLPAVTAAGLTAAELNPTYHVALPDLGAEFLRAGAAGRHHPVSLAVLRTWSAWATSSSPCGFAWFLFSAIARARPTRTGRRLAMAGQPRARLEASQACADGHGPSRSCLAAGWALGRAHRPPRAPSGCSPLPAGASVPSPTRAQPRRTGPARIPMSASPVTRASAPSGWPAPSACSATDSTRSPLGVMVLAVTGSALQTGLGVPGRDAAQSAPRPVWREPSWTAGTRST